jgi:hypothetical protein
MNICNTEKYALVTVPPPDNTNTGTSPSNWSTFLSKTKDISLPPGNKIQIQPNVWLIPLESGLPVLV